MPLAGDDAHCDLTLAFTKEVIAGMATGAEQPCNSLQFGIVRPDLVQSAEGTGSRQKKSSQSKSGDLSTAPSFVGHGPAPSQIESPIQGWTSAILITPEFRFGQA